MAIPVSRDTSEKQVVFGIKDEARDVVTLVATAAVTQGDFIVFGPWCGEALNSAAIGENVSVRIKEGIELSTGTLVSGEDTFGTLHAAVYFDSSAGEFSDTSTSGYYLVGYVTEVKSSDGFIKFEKLRYTSVVPA